ncbi:MAG: chemotaxis protein CheC [Gemmatimonadetes bacterium]|nr:chemotaxis protein CheC [Gemmatimonadota bacterium]
MLVDVPEVSIVPLEAAGGLLGDPGEALSAVIVAVAGDINGRTLQTFEGRASSRLVSLLLGTREPVFPEGFHALERSALKEIGNVIVAAYVNALQTFTGLTLTMSVPDLAIDMAAAILMTTYLNFGATEEDHVLSIGTRLRLKDSGELRGHFLLVPEKESLGRILSALRLA